MGSGDSSRSCETSSQDLRYRASRSVAPSVARASALQHALLSAPPPRQRRAGTVVGYFLSCFQCDTKVAFAPSAIPFFRSFGKRHIQSPLPLFLSV